MFDTTRLFGKDMRMSRLSQKIIAVLFAIWLPLFSGSALAASLTMQLPAGHCHDEMMPDMDMNAMDMSQMDIGDMQHVSDSADEHAPACDSCAICHMACTAYLAVPDLSAVALHTTESDITPYLLAFSSYSYAPLLPPPLARI